MASVMRFWLLNNGFTFLELKNDQKIYVADSFSSSPELKAQVSFSDRLSSVVCLSVRLSVNFSHGPLLLQKHWANFNQTWHKASLGEVDSSFFNEWPIAFPRGDNYEIVTIH